MRLKMAALRHLEILMHFVVVLKVLKKCTILRFLEWSITQNLMLFFSPLLIGIILFGLINSMWPVLWQLSVFVSFMLSLSAYVQCRLREEIC
jgi:hypothetical protein